MGLCPVMLTPGSALRETLLVRFKEPTIRGTIDQTQSAMCKAAILSPTPVSKMYMDIPYDTVIPFLGSYPKNTKI